MVTVVKILAGIPLIFLSGLLSWFVFFKLGAIIFGLMDTSSNIYILLNIMRYLGFIMVTLLVPFIILVKSDLGNRIDKVIG